MPTRLGRSGVKVDRLVSDGGAFFDVSAEHGFVGSWFDILDVVAEDAAQDLRAAVMDVYDNDGKVGKFPPWEPNDPYTLEWKAPSQKIMRGRYGVMKQAAQHVDVVAPGSYALPGAGRVSMLRPGRGAHGTASRFVGIFDTSTHPDTDGISVAEMFLLHEMGVPTQDGGDWHIPPRPWLSRAGDAAGPRVMLRMEAALKALAIAKWEADAAAATAALIRELQKSSVARGVKFQFTKGKLDFTAVRETAEARAIRRQIKDIERRLEFARARGADQYAREAAGRIAGRGPVVAPARPSPGSQLRPVFVPVRRTALAAETLRGLFGSD